MKFLDKCDREVIKKFIIERRNQCNQEIYRRRKNSLPKLIGTKKQQGERNRQTMQVEIKQDKSK